MTICCLGDLVLDVIVRLEQPLATGADATSRIVLRPGGQAANVAAWVAALGGRSRFVGKRGADDAGALAASRLLDLGVELVGPVEPEGTGVIVSLVHPSGERTMCADRGVAPELRPEEVEAGWFEGCEHLHVSGYALLREPVRFAALPRNRARASGRRPGERRPLVVERDPRLRRRAIPLAPRGARSRRRLRERGGGAHRRRPHRGRRLDRQAGPAGASFDGDERAALPVDRVVDSTGAGDAFAAGWLVGGPDLALEAAARCVQQAGSMPEASQLRSIRNARPDPRQRRGADGPRGGTRRRRARDDARRARLPRSRRCRDGSRERGCGSGSRRRAGHDRRARRADPDRAGARASSSVSRPPPASSGRATSPSARCRARSARRRSVAR